MSNATPTLPVNRLLADLPSRDTAFLASISRIERPPRGCTLDTRSAPTGDLWFPHSGVVALIATDATGRSVQTGMVGPEGCVGLDALFDSPSALPEAVVQIEGRMSVMPASRLRAAMAARPSIQTALARFLCGLSAQSLQTVACNRLHGLTPRCCRWLLTMRDLTGQDDLPVTQENLATLLGSGRSRVNLVLATLEKAGLLLRSRGHIRLLSSDGLEAQACDCYRDGGRDGGACG